MMVPGSSGKVKIEGIKLSCELFAVQLRNPGKRADLHPVLCRVLAESKVNIAFLSLGHRRGEELITCCVAAEDQHQVRKLVSSRPDIAAGARFLPGVGLLSLFPHQGSYRLMGLSLSALLRAAIPVHAMASSLSMLTFVIEYACLERAVQILSRLLEVPTDHVPLRPQIRVIQTDKIKEHDA